MEPPTDIHRPTAENQANPDAPSTARRASWLAWSLAALSVAMFLASLPLYILARAAQVPSSWSTSLTVSGLLTFVPFLAFPIVGAMIASRRPRNPIGWICLADGLLWMLLNLFDYYSVYGLAKPGSVPFPVAVAGLSQWLWVPTVGLLAIYLVLPFPDGRLLSRRWRLLAWLSGALIVLASASSGLAPGPLPDLGGVRNPFGLEGAPWVAVAASITLALLLLCILASAVSLVLRYRRSRGEERQQIKWIAFAASFVGIMFVSLMGISLIAAYFASESWGPGTEPLWVRLLFYLMVLSFGGVPISVGFAVLRYRLYDIDILINRTLVYGTVTATLVLIYVGCVVSLQYAFRVLTGQETQLAVVASTLVIAAMFGPLRRRVQAFVDRRFFRNKYDATKTLEAFGATLRDETDLKQLNGGLLAVVRETLQPAHASLWLKPARTVRGTEEQDR
jgi:MFS family permease